MDSPSHLTFNRPALSLIYISNPTREDFGREAAVSPGDIREQGVETQVNDDTPGGSGGEGCLVRNGNPGVWGRAWWEHVSTCSEAESVRRLESGTPQTA